MKEEIDSQIEALVHSTKAQPSPELPSAAAIWWRAQLAEKSRLREGALLPIRCLRGLSAAGLCSTAVVLFYLGMRTAALNSAAVAVGGTLVAATHLATFWVYRTFSARHKQGDR